MFFIVFVPSACDSFTLLRLLWRRSSFRAGCRSVRFGQPSGLGALRTPRSAPLPTDGTAKSLSAPDRLRRQTGTRGLLRFGLRSECFRFSWIQYIPDSQVMTGHSFSLFGFTGVYNCKGETQRSVDSASLCKWADRIRAL